MSTTRQPDPSRRHRRSANEWQQLLQQFAASGLSGPQFCKMHQIPYPTFQQWRQRTVPVASSSSAMIPAARSPLPFVELSPLDVTGEPKWHITLKLGNGVELCLSQG